MGDAPSLGDKPVFYSSLASDPALARLVRGFVDEIPHRVASLTDCLTEADWEGLGRLAHQLKSAVGSYGFPQLVPAAGRLEATVREGLAEDLVEEALEELAEMCHRIRAGAPPP